MRYGKSLLTWLLAAGFLVLLPAFALLLFIAPFKLKGPTGIPPFAYLSWVTGALVLLPLYHIFKNDTIIKSVDVENDGVSINRLLHRERLDGIQRLVYKEERGVRGIVARNIYITHSRGETVLMGVNSFSDYKGMLRELQQKTGLKVENAERLGL